MFKTKPNTPVNLVKLKNGTEVNEMTVRVTMFSLESGKFNFMLLYELLEKCKNPHHKMFSNTQQIAEEMGLMLEGTIHDDVKNIILSAVETLGPLSFAVNSPIAQSNVPYNRNKK